MRIAINRSGPARPAKPAVAHEVFDCIIMGKYCTVRYGYRNSGAVVKEKRPVREIAMAEVVPAHEQLAAHTRLALRRLASAVAVVTCRDGQTRHAMTATAVNAMSMQPPSMIVCVNRSSAFHAAISRAGCFAINILHRGQAHISAGCGGKARGEDRFNIGGWGEEHGVPVLEDAQAHIVCAKEDRFDYGSHRFFSAG